MKHIFFTHFIFGDGMYHRCVQSTKVDVWDFGPNNLIPTCTIICSNTDVINGWYDAGITPGTSGNVLPAFQVGALSWTGGTNDRLRTTNTALTRYDENIANSTEFTGDCM